MKKGNISTSQLQKERKQTSMATHTRFTYSNPKKNEKPRQIKSIWVPEKLMSLKVKRRILFQDQRTTIFRFNFSSCVFLSTAFYKRFFLCAHLVLSAPPSNVGILYQCLSNNTTGHPGFETIKITTIDLLFPSTLLLLDLKQSCNSVTK
mgnify:CR=1 FL=1